MKIFGLIGKDISYSFSAEYFLKKFQNEKIENTIYRNFDIPDITYFLQVVKKTKNLKGLNVTIPYKEEILPYLDELSSKAEKIGAVNCVKITKGGYLKGYNTDAYGFRKSIKSLLKKHHTKALVLGTGGASKAVAYTLNELGIEYKYVSRYPKVNEFSYSDISKSIMEEYTIVINCTPLGTFPYLNSFPQLNYNYFSDRHIAFDLVYNPSQTLFLQKALQNGASVQNGYKMLVFQAEKAWKVWNK